MDVDRAHLELQFPESIASVRARSAGIGIEQPNTILASVVVQGADQVLTGLKSP
ncbi:hypothetical protein [Sinorhizobium meliloti]|uniref:hypothetical protein n=1 Tax=Rhizobium meliloti TaxID=382 RepID=UPI0034E59B80